MEMRDMVLAAVNLGNEHKQELNESSRMHLESFHREGHEQAYQDHVRASNQVEQYMSTKIYR